MTDVGPAVGGGLLGRARRHPLLVLALLVGLQTAFTLSSRDYWAFDEPRHADALRGVLEDGHWLSLHLNGAPYPDKPPVYFWLAAGAARLLGTDGPPAFFLVSALGGFLFSVATWALARTTLPEGIPRRDDLALAAAVLVLLAPLTQLLLRTTRMDLLFGAAIVLAQVLLFRGIRTGGRDRRVVLGLALAGVAVVIKGPVGLALPLAALLAFLLWTGRARRLLRPDVLLGLALAAVPAGAWLIGIGLVEGWPYLAHLLDGQVVARTVGDHKHAHGAWFYPAVLPGAWLPWTAILAAGPLARRLGPRALRSRWARRRETADGGTWLWSCFLGGLLALSLATTKLFIYVMPLLAPLAVLTVDGYRRADPAGRARATRVAALILVALGAGLLTLPVLVPFEAVRFRPLDHAPGVLLVAGGLLGMGFGRRAPALILVVLFLAWIGVARRVVPRFDVVMSPRAQAEALARHADAGYAPLVFNVYRGTYAYHARRVLPETRDVKVLLAHLEAHPRAVVATARKYWDRWGQRLEDVRVVHEQRIEGQPHVLLLQDRVEEAPGR